MIELEILIYLFLVLFHCALIMVDYPFFWFIQIRLNFNAVHTKQYSLHEFDGSSNVWAKNLHRPYAATKLIKHFTRAVRLAWMAPLPFFDSPKALWPVISINQKYVFISRYFSSKRIITLCITCFLPQWAHVCAWHFILYRSENIAEKCKNEWNSPHRVRELPKISTKTHLHLSHFRKISRF